MYIYICEGRDKGKGNREGKKGREREGKKGREKGKGKREEKREGKEGREKGKGKREGILRGSYGSMPSRRMQRCFARACVLAWWNPKAVMY